MAEYEVVVGRKSKKASCLQAGHMKNAAAIPRNHARAPVRPNFLVRYDVVKLLERLDAETAGLVYLDPPWLDASSSLPNDRSRPRNATVGSQSELPAYLNWLSIVYQQAKRVCSSQGTVVLHVPPRLGSYARVMAERLFSPELVSEVIVQRKRLSNSLSYDAHVSLLFCRASPESTSNEAYRPLTSDEARQRFPHADERGRFGLRDLTGPLRGGPVYALNGITPPAGRSWRFNEGRLKELMSENRIYFARDTERPFLKVYENESAGVPVGTAWMDIPSAPVWNERCDYEEQQPLALLERIIEVTTNEEDLIVDPFMGSGTAIVAAVNLNRRWIGADTSDDAVTISAERLTKLLPSKSVPVLTAEDLGERTVAVQRYSNLAYGLISSEVEFLFIANEPVPIEETRHYEFKEIKGGNPVDSIKNVSDEYAVSFLNSEGGRIFWGIRDNDRVAVGVKLDSKLRDEVAKAIENKLAHIQPPLSPSYWRIRFHPVHLRSGTPVVDLMVVELTVSVPDERAILYATASNNVFVRSDSGKKKLNFLEIGSEFLRRSGRTMPTIP